MKNLVQTLVLVGLVGSPALAMADNHTSAHTLTGNVALHSDYIFRGISQTGGDPAVSGGLDYTHSSGFYAGTWASNVGWIEDYQGYDSGNIEIDLYAGFRGALGNSGVSYDVGILQFIYPGEEGGAVDADTTELYVGAGWKWFSAKLYYSIGDETFGFGGAEDSDGSTYLDLSVAYPIGETGLTVSAHWGTFSFENFGEQDYDDWKLGMSYDMGKLSSVTSGVTVGVFYSDTDADSDFWTDSNNEFLGDDAFVVFISKAL